MDEFTLSYLHLFNKRNQLSIYDISILTGIDISTISNSIVFLLRADYIQCANGYSLKPGELPTPDIQFELTHGGFAAMLSGEDQHKYRRFNEIRAWITLGISIISLVLSLISLFR